MAVQLALSRNFSGEHRVTANGLNAAINDWVLRLRSSLQAANSPSTAKPMRWRNGRFFINVPASRIRWHS